LAVVSSWRTTKTEPITLPSFSAIQQRSRAGSNSRTNLARISATRASYSLFQPYSCAYSTACRWMIQPMSPGCGLRRR
jgi:hypothetical protein